MGGNALAIDRETGQPLFYAGKRAEVGKNKPDFRKLDRSEFQDQFLKAFRAINNGFKSANDEFLWSPEKWSDLFSGGNVFNGSSRYLFSPTLSNEEFARHKPTVGDIDIMIPEQHIVNLYNMLASWEGKKITPAVTYIGQNKKSFGGAGKDDEGKQLNTIFYYTPTGSDDGLFVQIDFEAVDFEGDEPTEFARFSHNASWEDIQVNIKGAMHKYMLREMANQIQVRADIVVLTDASIKYLRGASKRKTAITIPDKKTIDSPWEMLSFSVASGLRPTYEPVFLDPGEIENVDAQNVGDATPEGDIPLVYMGKPVYRFVQASESRSRGMYVKTVEGIMRMIFSIPESRPVSESDVRQMESFTGLVELLKKYLQNDKINKIYLSFIEDKLFGPAAQRLSASSPEEDSSVKMAAVDYLREKFPFLSGHDEKLNELRKKYYEAYKVRESIREFVKLAIRS